MIFSKLKGKSQNRNGYTLVEMLIVVAIIGSIVGIVAPQLMKVFGDVKISTDAAIVRGWYIEQLGIIATTDVIDIPNPTHMQASLQSDHAVITVICDGNPINPSRFGVTLEYTDHSGERVHFGWDGDMYLED